MTKRGGAQVQPKWASGGMMMMAIAMIMTMMMEMMMMVMMMMEMTMMMMMARVGAAQVQPKWVSGGSEDIYHDFGLFLEHLRMIFNFGWL